VDVLRKKEFTISRKKTPSRRRTVRKVEEDDPNGSDHGGASSAIWVSLEKDQRKGRAQESLQRKVYLLWYDVGERDSDDRKRDGPT